MVAVVIYNASPLTQEFIVNGASVGSLDGCSGGSLEPLRVPYSISTSPAPGTFGTVNNLVVRTLEVTFYFLEIEPQAQPSEAFLLVVSDQQAFLTGGGLNSLFPGHSGPAASASEA
jgi:hypothetical protein